jgi:predicted phage tail protein
MTSMADGSYNAQEGGCAMLRRIKLYGRLAKFIGFRVLEADVSSAAEAVRFLIANWPELEAHMADQHYKVSLNTRDLSLEELHDPAGEQDISIAPVIVGAGSVGRILAGVALIALAFIPGVGTVAATGAMSAFGTALFGVGASLVLGGLAQIIAPTPVTQLGPDKNDDPKKSYSFSGIQNTSRAGVPVPIIFGEVFTGSVVISASIDVDQL